MKIVATPIKSQDLKAGDLFSTAGPEYWDREKASIGEKVYVRTETPCPEDQFDEAVFLLEIIR